MRLRRVLGIKEEKVEKVKVLHANFIYETMRIYLDIIDKIGNKKGMVTIYDEERF